jgi:hypothetical protein
MINPKVRVQQPLSLSKQTKPLAELEVATQHSAGDAVMEQDVRSYAYELYERRGGTEGHAVEDWLMAEARLAERQNHRVKTIA